MFFSTKILIKVAQNQIWLISCCSDMEQNGGTQERDTDQDHDKYSDGEHGQEWRHDKSRVRDWGK